MYKLLGSKNCNEKISKRSDTRSVWKDISGLLSLDFLVLDLILIFILNLLNNPILLLYKSISIILFCRLVIEVLLLLEGTTL